ncbi:LytTR family transcriptional regulator DNA-binding domain-containing protein [Paenibacillus konkukensis]|nr:LytTR family transcriptional regulator DNA-binding domain-containing protein [Paenibacillus konkukensis]
MEFAGGIKYVSAKTIVYISKEGKHVLVYAQQSGYEMQYTLQDMEGSYQAQLKAIVELKSRVNGAYNRII